MITHPFFFLSAIDTDEYFLSPVGEITVYTADET